MTSPMPAGRGADLRRSSGFTLVELLVVLALLGVLAGMVAPRFRGTVRSIEAEEAAQRLRSELVRWRVAAAAHKQRIEVEFTPHGGPELSVSTFEPARHPAWDFTPVQVGETRAGLRRRVVSLDFAGTLEADPPQLVFHPDGTSSETSILLKSARGRTYQIDVRSHDVVLSDPAGPRS